MESSILQAGHMVTSYDICNPFLGSNCLSGSDWVLRNHMYSSRTTLNATYLVKIFWFHPLEMMPLSFELYVDVLVYFK